MERAALIAILCWNAGVVPAQEMSKGNQQVVSDFIELVKGRKEKEIGKLITFPFDRMYPLPTVKNISEFLRRYDEIFDSSLTSEIVNSKLSDWSEVGWRGIMLLNGDLWLDYDGRIIAVINLSSVEKQKRKALIQQDKARLYPSIQNFIEPIFLLETLKYRIRIDDLGNNNYRYISWPLTGKMGTKPALVIENGEIIAEGSGGNHSYKFKQGDYVYECSIIVIGTEDDPPARLTVSKGDKVILSEKAKIISN
jgi:hypothetical protein